MKYYVYYVVVDEDGMFWSWERETWLEEPYMCLHLLQYTAELNAKLLGGTVKEVLITIKD